MPTFVGFEHSNFDAEKYRQAVCDNHGQTLSTEGVREGIASVAQQYDQDPKNHWLTAMMDTAAYVSRPT